MTTRAKRRVIWQSIVDEFEASGLSLRAFAAQRELSPSTLHRWRRHYRPRQGHSRPCRDVAPDFIEIKVVAAGSSPIFIVATEPKLMADQALALAGQSRC